MKRYIAALGISAVLLMAVAAHAGTIVNLSFSGLTPNQGIANQFAGQNVQFYNAYAWSSSNNYGFWDPYGGNDIWMEYDPGISNWLSFSYGMPYSAGPASVTILSSTQSVLASVSLGQNSSYLVGQNLPTTITFNGTAQYVVFSGPAGYVTWGQLSFDPVNPDAPTVPEPSSLMLLGSGLLVAAGAFRRRF